MAAFDQARAAAFDQAHEALRRLVGELIAAGTPAIDALEPASAALEFEDYDVDRARARLGLKIEALTCGP